MRGRGLILDPLWSSGWSFLACLLLKVQKPLCRTWWGQGLFTHELTETEKGLSQYLPVDFFHVTINGRSLFPCGLQMSDHLDALGELQTLIKYFKLSKKDFKVMWRVWRWQAPWEIQVVSGLDSLKCQKHLQSSEEDLHWRLSSVHGNILQCESWCGCSQSLWFRGSLCWSLGLLWQGNTTKDENQVWVNCGCLAGCCKEINHLYVFTNRI